LDTCEKEGSRPDTGEQPCGGSLHRDRKAPQLLKERVLSGRSELGDQLKVPGLISGLSAQGVNAGVGTIKGVADRLRVHRRMVRQALADAQPPERKRSQRERPVVEPLIPSSTTS
jgi:hypothetical protein